MFQICLTSWKKIMHLEFRNWNLPIRKRPKEAHIPRSHKAQCPGLYVKRYIFCWLATGLPVGLSVTFLLCVNQGTRPYADICGMCVCVYAHGVCRCILLVDLRLWLNPAQKMSHFYITLRVLCVSVCMRERKVCTYDVHIMSRCMYSYKLPINKAMNICLCKAVSVWTSMWVHLFCILTKFLLKQHLFGNFTLFSLFKLKYY